MSDNKSLDIDFTVKMTVVNAIDEESLLDGFGCIEHDFKITNAIIRTENCGSKEEIAERLRPTALQGLANLYHAITGEDCEEYVALGMATSAVSSLIYERDQLRNTVGRLESLHMRATQERNDLQRELTEARIAIDDATEHHAELEQELANLCDRHRRGKLPHPKASVCVSCTEEQLKRKRATMSIEGAGN